VDSCKSVSYNAVRFYDDILGVRANAYADARSRNLSVVANLASFDGDRRSEVIKKDAIVAVIGKRGAENVNICSVPNNFDSMLSISYSSYMTDDDALCGAHGCPLNEKA